MIQIENINKSFGRFKVLDSINLQFDQGACIALIGPNGCGKTTLIKTILGMVLPNSGSIHFDGENIAGAFKYRKHIGYMPQIGRYPDHMNIGQIVTMVQQIRNSETASDTDLYQAYKLDEMLHKPMRTLSGGTRQKVSAALAFMFDPKVLILDEPTAGLDPLASEILKEKIQLEKQKGKLVLITSHFLSELDDLITEVVYMQEGRVRFHEPLESIQQKTSEMRVSAAIGKILKQHQHE